MLERGTFHLYPPHSDPTLISYFQLRSTTGVEAKRGLSAVLVGAYVDRCGDIPLEASPRSHRGGNAGTCYSVHRIASPHLVPAL